MSGILADPITALKMATLIWSGCLSVLVSEGCLHAPMVSHSPLLSPPCLSCTMEELGVNALLALAGGHKSSSVP